MERDRKMKKIALLALSLVFGCTFLAQAESLPGEKFTMVDMYVDVTNVDEHGKITRGKKEVIRKIIPHVKEGETVDKEKILELSKIARKEKKETQDKEVTLSFLGDIANQVSDFINAAKGGVGKLAGSAAGLASATVVDAAVGAVAGILVP